MADTEDARYYILIPHANEGKRWKSQKQVRNHFFDNPDLKVSGGKLGPVPEWIGGIITRLWQYAGNNVEFVCLGPLGEEHNTWYNVAASGYAVGSLGPVTAEQESRMSELWSVVRQRSEFLRTLVDEIQDLDKRASQDRQRLTEMRTRWPGATDTADRLIGEIDRIKCDRQVQIVAAATQAVMDWRADIAVLARLVESTTRNDKTLKEYDAVGLTDLIITVVRGQPILREFPL